MVEVGVLRMFLDEAIYQLGEVEAAGHMPEVCTQVEKVLTALGLRHNVQVTAKRQLQLAAVQQVQVACQLADGAARAFSDDMHLALMWSNYAGVSWVCISKMGMWPT